MVWFQLFRKLVDLMRNDPIIYYPFIYYFYVINYPLLLVIDLLNERTDIYQSFHLRDLYDKK